MFETVMTFLKKLGKKDNNKNNNSKNAAKERLHLVLMQDRANVSADFLELMKQEIIEVIKKYIDIDESAIDVRLTNKENADGTNGAPALYANIPILNIKNESRKIDIKDEQKQDESVSSNETNTTEDMNNEKKVEENNATIETIQVDNEIIDNKQEENKDEKQDKEQNEKQDGKQDNIQSEEQDENEEKKNSEAKVESVILQGPENTQNDEEKAESEVKN